MPSWIVRVDTRWSGEETYFVREAANEAQAKGAVIASWRDKRIKQSINMRDVKMSAEQVSTDSVVLVTETSYDFD